MIRTLDSIRDKPSVGFMFTHGITADACQRCRKRMEYGSRGNWERSASMQIYNLDLPQGQQRIFELQLCVRCTAWLAERLWAVAHDQRIPCNRKNGKL